MKASSTHLCLWLAYTDILTPTLTNHHIIASALTRPTISTPSLSLEKNVMKVFSLVYIGLLFLGLPGGGNSRQRLQKSFSLDETKTKMASCIIKSVLSKKMQEEQKNSKTSHLQKKSAVLTSLPQPADQQRLRDGGGSKTGGGIPKAPVHVVRDVRSLVKNIRSLSFSAAENNNKLTSIKVIAQEESPPPTYQQAVGVKDHDEMKRKCKASNHSSSTGGHITKVASSLSQSQDRKQSKTISRPITQQRRGSEPIINRSKVDDVTWPVELLDLPTNTPTSKPLSQLSQSERVGGVSLQAMTSLPHPPLTSRHPESTQERVSIMGVTSQFPPNSSQQLLHPCFYTPTPLPAFPPTLHPHVGKVSYLQTPVSYIQTQLQPPPASTLHMMRRSEENQSRSTGNTPDEPDRFINTYPAHRTRVTGDHESNSNTVTPATEEQHEQQKHQQQPFLCSVQGCLPAQVGSDLLLDITGSNAGPGTLLSGPAPCHVMLDPKSGRCFYVDMPPQPQRKMLLDPETGQYVQVFLPAASSAPNNGVVPVRCANPVPFAPSMINPAPTVLSLMQFQPTVAMSPMYATPCLPFTLHTPSVHFTHTAPWWHVWWHAMCICSLRFNFPLGGGNLHSLVQQLSATSYFYSTIFHSTLYFTAFICRL